MENIRHETNLENLGRSFGNVPAMGSIFEGNLAEYNTSSHSFAEEGYPVRLLANAAREADRKYNDRFMRVLEAFTEYIANPRNHRLEYAAKEAMSTSDFPLLFSDVLNKMLLAEYNAIETDWRSYISVNRVKDFREHHAYAISGGDAALDIVTELSEYKERRFYESEYKYKLGKYGNRLAFSFEIFFNDDLGALERGPRVLARGGRRREVRFATALFVDASGPHASLYKTNHATTTGGTYSNIVPGNPAFGHEAFQAAWDLMGSYVDEYGEPIDITAAHLVIPRSLEMKAQEMFGAAEWEKTVEGRIIRIPNPFKGRVTVHVNPYIPIIASTANGNTSWFLFADPNNGRPAVEVAFLAGQEEPQLFQKIADQARIGGGGASIADGDFNTDKIQSKVRMFIGGGRMDPRSTVASNGSGS